MKLFELAVLASDPPHRAGDRAHHHRLGFDHILTKPHPVEQRTVGDAGRGEQAIALHHVSDLVLLARGLDAHFPPAVRPFPWGRARPHPALGPPMQGAPAAPTPPRGPPPMPI